MVFGGIAAKIFARKGEGQNSYKYGHDSCFPLSIEIHISKSILRSSYWFRMKFLSELQ